MRALRARKRRRGLPMGFHRLKGLRRRLRAYMAHCGRCGGLVYQDGLTLDIRCLQCGNTALYGPVKPEERRFEPPLDDRGRRLRGAAAAA